MSRFGIEIAYDPSLSGIERLYAWLFGAPVLGMRIRARYLLPVMKRLQNHRLTRVADAGSGRGCFAFSLARLFPDAQVTGLDVAEPQVARNNGISRRLKYTNCRFAILDVTQLPESAGYDLILSTDNLEHLEDDQTQCGVFYRALAPGGRILFHVPHLTRNLFGWRRLNFMGIEGHVRPGYTRDGLSAMLQKAGFQIESSFYSYGSVETLVNDVSYLITGGREQRRALYALAFPFLLALSQFGRLLRPREGSGLVILARKPDTE